MSKKKLKTYYIDEDVVTRFDYECNKIGKQKGYLAEMSLKLMLKMIVEKSHPEIDWESYHKIYDEIKVAEL